MRRIIVVITLALASLISASGQTPRSRGQAVRPKGKALVNKLPVKAQGVTLKKGTVRLKPGYKFVKQEDGSVTVARIRGGGGGGLGIGGSWDCGCISIGVPGGDPPEGRCSAQIAAGGVLFCNKGTCNGGCELEITIDRVKTGVIMY